MFNKMKYIVIDGLMAETPYIFPDSVQHSYVAQALSSGANNVVISAGFVVHRADGMQCYGRSVSLDIDSRPDVDSALINRLLGLDIS